MTLLRTNIYNHRHLLQSFLTTRSSSKYTLQMKTKYPFFETTFLLYILSISFQSSFSLSSFASLSVFSHPTDTTSTTTTTNQSSIIRRMTSDNSSDNETNTNNENVTKNNHPNAEQLQSQWAEGIDIWPFVPITLPYDSPDLTTTTATPSSTTENSKNTISIQTRVLETNTKTTKQNLPWPKIVRHSILYGFGAYNPLGQVLPDDVNQKQHLSLKKDLESLVSTAIVPDTHSSNSKINEKKQSVMFWEGASIWPDGSFEKGFIVAFPKNEFTEKGIDMYNEESILSLAKKYNQGAIYRFNYETQEKVDDDNDDGRNPLRRETVAVLVDGTDADVFVVRDNECISNLSSLGF